MMAATLMPAAHGSDAIPFNALQDAVPVEGRKAGMSRGPGRSVNGRIFPGQQPSVRCRLWDLTSADVEEPACQGRRDLGPAGR
jgi:hypothetical protein